VAHTLDLMVPEAISKKLEPMVSSFGHLEKCGSIHNIDVNYSTLKTVTARPSGIGGLDYWTGIMDWNTGMA